MLIVSAHSRSKRLFSVFLGRHTRHKITSADMLGRVISESLRGEFLTRVPLLDPSYSEVGHEMIGNLVISPTESPLYRV